MNLMKMGIGGGIFCLAALFGAGLFSYWLIQGPEVIERDLAGLKGDVQRGSYVARLSGCIGCHTNAKEGGPVLAGGAEISTDFGKFYAPNITPDPDDGIGSWSLLDFSKALTSGVSKEGNHLFPSFPYTFYKNLTDQDVVDLWAAVQSVPAIKGGPPEHGLRFPFGFHQGVGAWKRLFFDPEPLKNIPEMSEEWNRGRYLANGPAHCGACHTPRNLIGGRDTDQKYEGGVGPGKEKIPAITVDDLESNKWEKDDLMYALRTGIKPNGDVFGGSMAEVVRDGTRYWSDQDLQAIVTYLTSGDLR